MPLRKPGKLPSDTKTISYQLEYGTATLEVHKDALASPRVVADQAGGVYVITQLRTIGTHAHVVNFFDDGPRIVDQDINWGSGLLLAQN